MTAATLLIDDYQPYIQGWKSTEKLLGVELDYETTFEAGLAAFLLGGHELIICDYNLKGTQLGLEFLGQAKELRPSTRLILISGALKASAPEIVSGATFVNAFYPKDNDLPERLLGEIQAAHDRASAPTNWREVASAFLKADIDAGAIAEIDAALRAQIP